jgi:hypothetical protein
MPILSDSYKIIVKTTFYVEKTDKYVTIELERIQEGLT